MCHSDSTLGFLYEISRNCKIIGPSLGVQTDCARGKQSTLTRTGQRQGKDFSRVCAFNQNHASRKVIERSRGKTPPKLSRIIRKIAFPFNRENYPIFIFISCFLLSHNNTQGGGWGKRKTLAAILWGKHRGNTYHCDTGFDFLYERTQSRQQNSHKNVTLQTFLMHFQPFRGLKF